MIVDGLHQCSVYKLYYYFLNNYNNITKVMINNEFTLNKEERYKEYLDYQIPVTQLEEYLDYQIPVTQLYLDYQIPVT